MDSEAADEGGLEELKNDAVRKLSLAFLVRNYRDITWDINVGTGGDEGKIRCVFKLYNEDRVKELQKTLSGNDISSEVEERYIDTPSGLAKPVPALLIDVKQRYFPHNLSKLFAASRQAAKEQARHGMVLFLDEAAKRVPRGNDGKYDEELFVEVMQAAMKEFTKYLTAQNIPTEKLLLLNPVLVRNPPGSMGGHSLN